MGKLSWNRMTWICLREAVILVQKGVPLMTHPLTASGPAAWKELIKVLERFCPELAKGIQMEELTIQDVVYGFLTMDVMHHCLLVWRAVTISFLSNLGRLPLEIQINCNNLFDGVIGSAILKAGSPTRSEKQSASIGRAWTQSMMKAAYRLSKQTGLTMAASAPLAQFSTQMLLFPISFSLKPASLKPMTWY